MKNVSLIFSTILYTVRLMVNSGFEMNARPWFFYIKWRMSSDPLLCCNASCFLYALNSALKLVNSHGLIIIKWYEIKINAELLNLYFFYILPGLILWWETERGLTTCLIPISHKEINSLRTHLFFFISIWNNTSRSTLFCLTNTQAPDFIW